MLKMEQMKRVLSIYLSSYINRIEMREWYSDRLFKKVHLNAYIDFKVHLALYHIIFT